jgi:endoglucanase
MRRRSFLGGIAAAGLIGRTKNGPAQIATSQDPLRAKIQTIPHWRGFNLQWERRHDDDNKPAFQEFDFATMQEWGFNFARIPLSYWIWGNPKDWTYINEAPLKEIDRVIDLGKQHGIHINLNFHRIPGYCINERELEPADLSLAEKTNATGPSQQQYSIGAPSPNATRECQAST